MDQVNHHLQTGALSSVSPNDDQHVYRIFSVKKANGKDRIVIDLSPLNRQILKTKFSMEDHKFIRNFISQYDYLCSLDLADAFFSIPINEDSKKFLTFEIEGKRYAYNVLPFGLSSSPRVFTKILRPVITFLRHRGVKITAYLDDILICANSKSLLEEHLKLTLDLFSSLGFTVNFSKSSLIPSKTLIHLGYLWNTEDMTNSLPEVKLVKTRNFAKSLLSNPRTLRDISSFLGLVVSHKVAFEFAPLHYRHIQLSLIEHQKGGLSWDDYFSFDKYSYSELMWWASCPSSLAPACIFPFVTDISLYTDASLSGWGGYLSSGFSASGVWSNKFEHINSLELKAILNSVLALLPHIRNSSVRLLCDNISSVFYVNKFGGTQSISMCLTALKIWDLLITNNVKCRAFHLPGVSNVKADYLSRNLRDHNDFGLSHVGFEKLVNILPFSLTIDLFASNFSFKLKHYVSRDFDKNAWQTDAFSFKWSKNYYIFPPINLLPKVISKFKCDETENSVLLTPSWKSLSVMPSILDLLIDFPIFIPSGFIEGQLPTRHQFNVLAWPISCCFARKMDFQKKLLKHSSIASPLQPFRAIPGFGDIFMSGSEILKTPLLFQYL